MRAGFLIRKINGSRLLSEVGRRARSIAPAIERCEIKDAESESQHVQPYKDIPGPKKLPLIGNFFRFVPYIGKRRARAKIFIIARIYTCRIERRIITSRRNYSIELDIALSIVSVKQCPLVVHMRRISLDLHTRRSEFN